MRLRERAARALAAAEGFVLEPAAGESPTAATTATAAPAPPPVIVATGVGGAGGVAALGAAIAVRGANGRAPLLAEFRDPAGSRGPTLLASGAARDLEELMRRELDLASTARGYLCHLALPIGEDGLEVVAGAVRTGVPALAVLALPPGLWTAALDHDGLEVCGGLIRADLPADRALVALAVADLRRRGLRARVAPRPLGRVTSRRALAGAELGGAAAARVSRLAGGLLGQRGQALPAVAGAALAILFAVLLLAAVGGATTAKGRAQRAADLAAISAARSMRDDLDRLFAPSRLPGGSPNPRHVGKPLYLSRAARAARHAARKNGVSPRRLRVEFPDRRSFAPLRVRARVFGRIHPRDLPRARRRPRPIRVTARAVAEVSPPIGITGMPGYASGGGYAGPLAYRQGEPMRPDVAAAFDRMASAARRAGVGLVITSAFRSDAEQARLFAAHPDPRWVAPPGRSLHRCATELDLGPPFAYAWLAAHAGRFGFLKRYSWEPWHFGYTRGPAPCSAAGNAAGTGERAAASGGLPAFVPSRYRSAILRSAARWNVSAALISAQLMAESNFNPYAVSPAGAQGIAQFIPATAHADGLRNPFDALGAIDAQAHLMSDLLRRFRSIPLALAATRAPRPFRRPDAWAANGAAIGAPVRFGSGC